MGEAGRIDGVGPWGLKVYPTLKFAGLYLVGGLEHVLFLYIYIYSGNNNPNWLIFFRGVGIPPTNIYIYIHRLIYTLENGESNWQLMIDIFRCVFYCHELMWMCWIFFGSFSNMGQDKMSPKEPTCWVVFGILPEYCDTVHVPKLGFCINKGVCQFVTRPGKLTVCISLLLKMAQSK